MSKKAMPIDNVKWVHLDKVEANDADYKLATEVNVLQDLNYRK